MSQLQVTGEAKIRDIQGPVVANSGVITALDGAASQYVRGDGTLADFPTSTGGGSSVSYYLNSSVSQGTIGGVAYRELSKEPIIGAGTDITISANGYVASYITDANDPDVLSVPGGNFNCEFYFSVNNNTGNPTTYAELYKYDGTTFTLLGSSQAVPESLNQGTTIAPYYFAIPVATAALALTDRLAIRIYVSVDGRVVTLHTENSHLCQVVTTFSKGMVSLNNLTDQSQFITTGTSGTNFNIVSSGDTHTFNLPTASATNTGKLSNTDWSTFNNKVPYTGATGNVDLGTRDLTSRFIYLNGIGTTGGNLFLRKDVDPAFTLNYTTLYSTDNNIGFGSTDGTNTKKAIFSFDLLTNNTLRTFTLPDASGTIALTSNLSAYVPYSGATGNLDLGGYSLYLNNSQAIFGRNFTGSTAYALIGVNPSNKVSIDTSGLGVVLGGALSGTSASFNATVSSIAASGGSAFTVINSANSRAWSLIPYTNGAESDLWLYYGGTGGGTKVSFVNNGNVLIGSTTDAGFKLDVSGTGRFTGGLSGTTATFSGLGTFYQLTMTGATAGRIFYAQTGGVVSQSGNLNWDNTNEMLGVGTPNPTAVITAFSNNAATQFKAAGTAPAFTFSQSLTTSTYACVFGLATSANHFITGTAAGDMAIANQSATAGAIVFGTGTAEKMRMSPSGRLLVGTSVDSGALFQVNGTTNLTGALSGTSATFSGQLTASTSRVNGRLFTTSDASFGDMLSTTGVLAISYDAAGQTGYITSRNYTTSTNTPLVFTSSAATFSSSVFIGSSITSAATLHVNNALSADPTSLSSVPTTNVFGMSTSPGAMLAAGIGTSGGSHVWLQGRNTGGAGVSYPISLQPLGGNVGIGTSSPDYPLVVQANSSAAQAVKLLGRSVDNISILSFHNNANSTQYGYIAGIPSEFRINSGSSIPITFTNLDTERMRITSGGNVGIGTSSPSVALQIVKDGSNVTGNYYYNTRLQDAAAARGLIFGYISGETTGFIGADQVSGNIAFLTHNGSSWGERMRITSGGEVLIGKTSTANFGTAGWQLGANGTGLAVFAINNNEAFTFNNINTGTTYEIDFRTNALERGKISVTDSGVSYVTTSDYRVKEDFKEINGLEKVSAIKVYDFKFKDMDLRTDGVIAHELQEVLPYAVTGEKDGEKYQGVDYSKIVPVNTKAIQELYQLVLAQDAKIEELKALINK